MAFPVAIEQAKLPAANKLQHRCRLPQPYFVAQTHQYLGTCGHNCNCHRTTVEFHQDLTFQTPAALQPLHPGSVSCTSTGMLELLPLDAVLPCNAAAGQLLRISSAVNNCVVEEAAGAAAAITTPMAALPQMSTQCNHCRQLHKHSCKGKLQNGVSHAPRYTSSHTYSC